MNRRDAIKAVGVGAASLCLGNYSFAQKSKYIIENCWSFIDPDTNHQRFIETIPLFVKNHKESIHGARQTFFATRSEFLIFHSPHKLMLDKNFKNSQEYDISLHILCQNPDHEILTTAEQILMSQDNKNVIKAHSKIKKYTLNLIQSERIKFLDYTGTHYQLGFHEI